MNPVETCHQPPDTRPDGNLRGYTRHDGGRPQPQLPGAIRPTGVHFAVCSQKQRVFVASHDLGHPVGQEARLVGAAEGVITQLSAVAPAPCVNIPAESQSQGMLGPGRDCHHPGKPGNLSGHGGLRDAEKAELAGMIVAPGPNLPGDTIFHEGEAVPGPRCQTDDIRRSSGHRTKRQ